MFIGGLGNITVIIHTTFTGKEKTATSYLVGNLALADLLVCLTFYPIWIIEFILTILNVDGDQDLFCKFSRSSIKALVFVSIATLVAITLDKYFYIVKPLKYPLIVTKRRVFAAVGCIWMAACCVFVVIWVHTRKSDEGLRGWCYVDFTLTWLKNGFTVYLPLTLIIILNVWILIVAEKQQKRIVVEMATNTSDVKRFFHALKAVKTFIIVVVIVTFCVIMPTVVGLVLHEIPSCNVSCQQLWFAVIHYELYGINSIVNAFIYGMRHIKCKKAYRQILFNIICCKKTQIMKDI